MCMWVWMLACGCGCTVEKKDLDSPISWGHRVRYRGRYRGRAGRALQRGQGQDTVSFFFETPSDLGHTRPYSVLVLARQTE
jgi:hypothetical protein